MADEPLVTIKSARLGAALRNPLTVFGLILVAGDGPLVVAYGLAIGRDPTMATVFAWALIGLVAAMSLAFILFLAIAPRRLYAPGEIPERALGRSIFREGPSVSVETAMATVETSVEAVSQKYLAAMQETFQASSQQLESVQQQANANEIAATARRRLAEEAILTRLAEDSATAGDPNWGLLITTPIDILIHRAGVRHIPEAPDVVRRLAQEGWFRLRDGQTIVSDVQIFRTKWIERMWPDEPDDPAQMTRPN